MWRGLLMSCALLARLAALDFPSSAVYTTADIPLDSPVVFGTRDHDHTSQTYRVYATFAAGGDEEYAGNVKITNANGTKTLDVATLARSASIFSNCRACLDGEQLLQAPITIHDTNRGAVRRVPFTIYIVSVVVDPLPVLNARHAKGRIDYSFLFASGGITILSAEHNFTLSNFYTDQINGTGVWGASHRMDVHTAGFDAVQYSSVFRVGLTLAPRFDLVTIDGPIASVSKGFRPRNYMFSFDFARNEEPVEELPPTAAVHFMSPLYVEAKGSYNTSYPRPRSIRRFFTFPEDTEIMATVGRLDKEDEKHVHLTVFHSNGTESRAVFSRSYMDRPVLMGNAIEFRVNHLARLKSPFYVAVYAEGPRDRPLTYDEYMKRQSSSPNGLALTSLVFSMLLRLFF